jgi:hypothetical protein
MFCRSHLPNHKRSVRDLCVDVVQQFGSALVFVTADRRHSLLCRGGRGIGGVKAQRVCVRLCVCRKSSSHSFTFNCIDRKPPSLWRLWVSV